MSPQCPGKHELTVGGEKNLGLILHVPGKRTRTSVKTQLQLLCVNKQTRFPSDHTRLKQVDLGCLTLLSLQRLQAKLVSSPSSL